jgi:hypothetical protein
VFVLPQKDKTYSNEVMSNTEARDSDNDFFDSCSSPTPQKSVLEQINPKKRPKEPSTSSESPSPTVQKPKTTKLRRTSNVSSETMDPAMQKFFRDLILESEERTKNVIKSETASVKDSVSKAIDSLEKTVNVLKQELETLHAKLRMKNIIIQGIPHKKDETWKDLELVLKDVFMKLKINEKLDYDECYRIGPYSSTTRPIMLKLLRQKDKKMIMANRKNLKGTTIYINDDNPKDVRKKLAILRSRERQLRIENPTSKIFIRNQVLIYRNGATTKHFIVDENDDIIEKSRQEPGMEY